jgi:probable FeS assembly SUF system protein SufT
MNTADATTLTRACEAIAIPYGDKTQLAAGTPVTITQSLGGAYTVLADGRLLRIEGKDADALGLAAPATPFPAVPPPGGDGPLDEERLWKQLKTCYDPEIPVNIVELGLVYDLHHEPLPEGGNVVNVKMTLTAPGCGMGAMIAEDVQRKVLAVPGVTEANVELVWDPPWSQAMMTEAAKLELGLN